MLKIYRLPAILALALLAATCALAQAPHSYPFRATNYDVEVILHPEDQTILGQAKVDFVAEQVAKTVLVELHAGFARQLREDGRAAGHLRARQ